MPLTQLDQQRIDTFLAEIQPWQDVYEKRASFNYFSVKHKGTFVLLIASQSMSEYHII